MERLSFAFTLSEEQKKKKEAFVVRLMKNDHVLAWPKRNGCDEDFVREHNGKFTDWTAVMDKCEGCHGLDFCRQPEKGTRVDLYLDGMLMNQISHCTYYKEQQEQYTHCYFYKQMDMLEDYLLVGVTRLSLQHEAVKYKTAVAKVIDLLVNEHPQKGLYLWGEPGAGKSWLAIGMYNYYAKQEKRVVFVDVPKLISDLKLLFHKPDAMEARLHSIRNAEVVVFDDIGGESVMAWSRDDILLPLMDARMEERRLTIFTSNYSMEELKQRLCAAAGKNSEPVMTERLLERIRALSCETFIKSETRRKQCQ